MRGFGRLDAGAQVLGVLQRRVVAGALRLQRRLRIVERLLRDQRALEQLARAIVGLLGLRELGGRLRTSGVFSISGRCSGSGAPYCASARASAACCCSKRVLLLLAIELDQHLAGLHAIAEVRQDRPHLAVGLRRDRHLIHGGKVPTTSTARRTESLCTTVTDTVFAVSPALAWAVSDFAQLALASAINNTMDAVWGG